MINKSYLIPAAIAAGVHALLLSISGDPAAPKPQTVAVTRLWEPPVLTDPETIITNGGSAAAGGGEEQPTIEPPPVSPTPGAFEIIHEQERFSVQPVVDLDSIPRLPPGIPGDATGDGVCLTINLDNHPRATFQPSPRTPGDVNLSSAATIEFSVDTRGRVYNPQVVESNDPRFEAAALAALKKWHFEPGMKNNHPVPFRMSQTFVFRTDG